MSDCDQKRVEVDATFVAAVAAADMVVKNEALTDSLLRRIWGCVNFGNTVFSDS